VLLTMELMITLRHVISRFYEGRAFRTESVAVIQPPILPFDTQIDESNS
jgi:hypothetical protein